MTRARLLMAVIVAGGCAASRPSVRAPIDTGHVPIVYGGGGAVQRSFAVSAPQWEELAGLFAGCEDAASERRAVRDAIGRMERIAGEQTVTWMDKSCNGNGGPTEQGQLDCIDESTNTTVYLRLFEQRGLLRFHAVRPAVWRAPHVVDTHRTAVLRDLADSKDYAVDSWFGDNGSPANVQLLSDWKRRVAPAR